MCNQLLVLYFKLMIYDEARATVKYLNYCMCYLPHAKHPHEQKMSEKKLCAVSCSTKLKHTLANICNYFVGDSAGLHVPWFINS